MFNLKYQRVIALIILQKVRTKFKHNELKQVFLKCYVPIKEYIYFKKLYVFYNA